jgi:predicted lactoylglutathione lyase
MSKKIFVNLPVKDLSRSMDFFTKVGISYNPQFSDERAACLIVSDDIYVMLLTEPFFRTFTKKEIIDATKGIETIVALGLDSREEVDGLAEAAFAAGAAPARETDDQTWMYVRSFHDLDGHLWEMFYMDVSAAQAQARA